MLWASKSQPDQMALRLICDNTLKVCLVCLNFDGPVSIVEPTRNIKVDSFGKLD